MATRNDPFRDLERFLDTAFRPGAGNVMTQMDLYRKGDAFVAELDLPGVDPGSIDIDIEDQTLTIRGERKPVAGEVQWITRERGTGTFARQFRIGYGIATDRIEATYTDGVLRLSIPVAEEAKPRKITVQHGGGQSELVEGQVEGSTESVDA